MTTKKTVAKGHVVTIKSLDEEQQIAFGEVYAPGVVDTHGEFMLAEDIEQMEERFMKLDDRNERIDRMHDNVSVDAYPVESFIAKSDDALYTEGAWVLGIKVTDDQLWYDIKSGKLNGYSFEAMVRKVPVVIDIEYEQDKLGETEETLGHTHLYFLKMDPDGRVVGGRTSTDLNHSHEINGGTGTDESLGHSHRFNF